MVLPICFGFCFRTFTKCQYTSISILWLYDACCLIYYVDSWTYVNEVVHTAMSLRLRLHRVLINACAYRIHPHAIYTYIVCADTVQTIRNYRAGNTNKFHRNVFNSFEFGGLVLFKCGMICLCELSVGWLIKLKSKITEQNKTYPLQLKWNIIKKHKKVYQGTYWHWKRKKPK